MRVVAGGCPDNERWPGWSPGSGRGSVPGPARGLRWWAGEREAVGLSLSIQTPH